LKQQGYQNKEIDLLLSEHPYLVTSISYPERGSFGDSSFPGNASGFLLVELINHFKPNLVYDPMEGSGTSKEVCEAINVKYVGNDLLKPDGYDLVTCKDEQIPLSDLTYFHPPYWNIIKYSNNPADLSNAPTWENFVHLLLHCIGRLLQKTRLLVILVADVYRGSDRQFHCILTPIMLTYHKRLHRILIKNQARSHFSHGAPWVQFRPKETPEIPVLHEYVILLKGDLNE